MIDTKTEAGARAEGRLRDEVMIWLTTVRSDGQPQSSAVWFLWDGDTFLIYSQPRAPKLRNIAGQPRVSLHLDGDGRGGDIVTIDGVAAIDETAPPVDQSAAYVGKYGELIGRMGYTPEAMAADYSQAIRVTPSRVRTG